MKPELITVTRLLSIKKEGEVGTSARLPRALDAAVNIMRKLVGEREMHHSSKCPAECRYADRILTTHHSPVID